MKKKENPGRREWFRVKEIHINYEKVYSVGMFAFWDEGTFWNLSTELGHTT